MGKKKERNRSRKFDDDASATEALLPQEQEELKEHEEKKDETEICIEDGTSRHRNKPYSNDKEETHVFRNKKAKQTWCAIIALSTGILGFILILSIFRVVRDANAFPTHRPRFPKSYEASVTFSIPYISLSEPLYVHMDEDRGLQKLSFYGDNDIYIFNASGNSYQIIPVMKELKCFKSKRQVPQHVFPNISLFKAEHGLFLVKGRSCYSWKYTTKKDVVDTDGHYGEYRLYIDIENDQPVQLHYVGRNLMFGGSHVDEYTLDYEYIRAAPIERHVFSTLPSLMNCTNISDYVGPSRNPMQDILLLFPESYGLKDALFQQYIDEHEKQYSTEGERMQRKAIFHQNLRYINAMNRKGNTFHLGINHLADMSTDEIHQFLTSGKDLKRKADNGATMQHPVYEAVNVSEVDWRKEGAVTPVKDQGSCGSCWSFGATGAIEGALFLKEKKLVNISEQNLIDCSWNFGNHACQGGFDYQSYNWIISSGGIEATDSYGSYRNLPDFCHFDPSRAVARLNGFANVTGIEQLNDALVHVGPLSVSIDATQPSFYFYAGGYYDDEKCASDIDSLDHLVLAVGFTTFRDQKFTLIKNSWGRFWGEDGYIKIAQKNNVCGVATAATYPLLANEHDKGA